MKLSDVYVGQRVAFNSNGKLYSGIVDRIEVNESEPQQSVINIETESVFVSTRVYKLLGVLK